MDIIKHFERLIVAVFIMVTVFSSFGVAKIVNAQVITGVPFGGVITNFVPATPICPFPHSVVAGVPTGVFGIALVPGSIVFLYGMLTHPGAFVLGSYLPKPLPCLLPYPIFPIIQVGTSQ